MPASSFLRFFTRDQLFVFWFSCYRTISDQELSPAFLLTRWQSPTHTVCGRSCGSWAGEALLTDVAGGLLWFCQGVCATFVGQWQDTALLCKQAYDLNSVTLSISSRVYWLTLWVLLLLFPAFIPLAGRRGNSWLPSLYVWTFISLVHLLGSPLETVALLLVVDGLNFKMDSGKISEELSWNKTHFTPRKRQLIRGKICSDGQNRGKKVDVFTGSSYAIGKAHDFWMLHKQR